MLKFYDAIILNLKTFIISVKGYAIIITLGRIMKRHGVTYNQQK